MYKWLDAKAHDVKTFNKIFNLSKLQGFNPREEVEIGEMLIGGLREVVVSNTTQLLELKSSNMDILIDKSTVNRPNFSDSEKDVIEYLKKNGSSKYFDIAKDLKLTRNIMWNTISSLNARNAIITDGKTNKTISLIDKDIDTKDIPKPEKVIETKQRFQNPEFINPIYELQPSTFKILIFIRDVKKCSGIDFVVKNTNISDRSVRSSLDVLESLNLIKKTKDGTNNIIEAIDD